jgi:hypothetical protein
MKDVDFESRLARPLAAVEVAVTVTGDWVAFVSRKLDC